MKRNYYLMTVALVVLALVSLAASPAPEQRNFVAHLSGSEEVPVVATLAQGQAIFHLSKDGNELHYKLIASNIENVVQAHIHVGAAGENGPVVAFLYGLVAPGGGRTEGVLAEGTITAADLIGPLAGKPLSAYPGDPCTITALIQAQGLTGEPRSNLAGKPLSALVDAMRSGGAYVNAHTNDGIDPPNTGAGDVATGEIRGQIH